MQPTTRNKRRANEKKFISFLLLIAVAAVLGSLFRYYNTRPRVATGGAWAVYFSEIRPGAPDKNNPYALDKRLVAKLETAAEGIDAALHQLNSEPIADAFIDAHRRGVQVRVVTETKYLAENQIRRLQEVGIPVADDDEHDGLMHHKFIVVDGRYVWTGSYNTTFNGAYRNNNNVIWLDSSQLAYNFTEEFREMFHFRQFGRNSDPSVQYPQVTLGDGTQVFTYFAPENETIPPILSEIQSAKTSIHFMAFAFTHDTLGDAMRRQFKAGIAVRGVFEERQISQYSEYEPMRAAGLPVIQDRTRGMMHHKVIVIDEETVITGSYNFSKNAEKNNSENLLIIKGNRDIARAYLDEFERITR